MSYVDQKTKDKINLQPEEQGDYYPESAGELNYVLTHICDNYIGGCEKLNYEKLNAIIGVLECAKQEFYRRVVAPYANYKIRVNGEVYCEEHAPSIESIINPQQLAHLDDPNWFGYDNFHKENK